MPSRARTDMGLGVKKRLIRVFTGFGGAPTPSKARTHMGLGVSSRHICTVDCAIMSICFLSFFIAPLPIRSYVGLGVNHRTFVVMNLNLWRIFGAPKPRSEPSKQSTRTDMGLNGQRSFCVINICITRLCGAPMPST